MLFDRIRQGFSAAILVIAVVLGDDWLRTAAWALFAIVALANLLTLYLTRDRARATPSPQMAAVPRTLAETVASNLSNSCFDKATWPAKMEERGAIRVRSYDDIQERMSATT